LETRQAKERDMELRLARREFTCCPEFSTPFLVACIATAGVTLVARDRNEKEMLSQLERSQAELRMLGGQIANIKDADLTSTNDFISAYAQIEPLEKK